MLAQSARDRLDEPAADPIARFVSWLDAAKAVGAERLPEPTAFLLATATPDAVPSVRAMLLKGVDDDGFVFYTNYTSRKAGELLANPRAAMVFHWQPLERQVRVEGDVSKVTDAEADAYFASRARISQLGAWASLQSQPMPDPDALDRRFAEFEAKFAGGDVPRPPHWSGFRVAPRAIEFWLAKPGRLHVRHRYTPSGKGWKIDTLFP